MLAEISVRVEIVTPILGGSSVPCTVDDVDVIRAATVRGHLRFWWRALYAVRYATARDLHEHESNMWGRAAARDGRGRSTVEVRIDIAREGSVDGDAIRLSDSKDGKATPGAYALWPARRERGTPPAPRRAPGTRFHLTVLCPADLEAQVRNAVRAWILFGGYGSRTRRGLGTLGVFDDAGAWLPEKTSRDALTHVFGFDALAPAGKSPGNVPSLGGAALHVGSPGSSAMQAWTTALGWLQEFRQGTSGARQPDPNGDTRRPSVSNWPEADKIRHLKGKKSAHPPRHNASVVWPRAGFGLPIIGQFQKDARNGGRYDEPDGFELRWRSGNIEHDRLASPLIVKALPLADGTFVPCALWLNRAYPAGDVILRGVNNSAAPFDRLVAPGDAPRFSALANKQSLHQAFLDWLQAKHGTTVVVAP